MISLDFCEANQSR